MSAGTLQLTNNSKAVTGTGTAFTTDVKAGDFIVTTVGGLLYTLPVDTVTGNTAVTLVSPYTGPSTTDAAWYAVPRKVQNQVTAELVAQSTEALRGLLAEKAVWTDFYTAPEDISVRLTPDMPPVSGPGWKKMSELVGSSLQWRGNLPAAPDLNTYGPTESFSGIWGMGTSAGARPENGFPEASAAGLLEVFPGGQFGGTQRYTVRNGSVYVRSLTGSWNGADGPWGDWMPVGRNLLNDLGLGLTALPWTSDTSFDWQQVDFIVGQVINTRYQQWVNGPQLTNSVTGETSRCYITTELAYGTTVAVKVTVYRGNAAADMFSILINGPKGSRTFMVRQIYTSTEISALGIGLPAMSAVPAFDWQQADFLTAATCLVSTSAWTNAPAAVSYPAGTLVYVHINGITTGAGATGITLIPDTATDSAYRVYHVRVTGAKGSRVFSVRREVLDTDGYLTLKNYYAAMPAVGQVVTGGGFSSEVYVGGALQTSGEFTAQQTSGSLWAGPRIRATFGANTKDYFFGSDGRFILPANGIITAATGDINLQSRLATTLPINRTALTAASFDSLYAANRDRGLSFEQMAVAGAGYLYPHMSCKVYWAGNYGGVFTWSVLTNASTPEYVLSWTWESGSTPYLWRFNAANGNATAPGNWINGGSSIKIKENFEEIENPRDTMRKIKAGTWRLKTKSGDGRFGIGVLAEGLYEDYPEAAVTAGDIELRDGTVVKDALSVQAGDSGVTVAVHHATILSLMDENSAQQVEIEALKSNLEELKKIVEGLIAR